MRRLVTSSVLPPVVCPPSSAVRDILLAFTHCAVRLENSVERFCYFCSCFFSYMLAVFRWSSVWSNCAVAVHFLVASCISSSVIGLLSNLASPLHQFSGVASSSLKKVLYHSPNFIIISSCSTIAPPSFVCNMKVLHLFCCNNLCGYTFFDCPCYCLSMSIAIFSTLSVFSCLVLPLMFLNSFYLLGTILRLLTVFSPEIVHNCRLQISCFLLSSGIMGSLLNLYLH